jgi:hypothetical protein
MYSRSFDRSFFVILIRRIRVNLWLITAGGARL